MPGDGDLDMTEPPRDAARVIRAWRRRTGLTQEGLARALGVTFSTVNRWENGHVKPSRLAWRSLVQLAKTLGPSLVDATDRQNDRSVETAS